MGFVSPVLPCSSRTIFATTMFCARASSVQRVSSVKRTSCARSSSANHYTLQLRFASTLRYSKDHEWVSLNGSEATIGISTFAQNALGDVVYVELPEVGATFKQKQTIASVESVKV